MRIVVRREEAADWRRVEEVARKAFAYPERIARGGIGCPYEHWIVHELRRRDGVGELSLVALTDGEIAGHIIGSRGRIETPGGKNIPVLDFGPLSVLPQRQRQDVGKALMGALIGRAREMGFGAIIFFGRPEYYPQFGFVEASRYGLTDCFGENDPAFMTMELIAGYLSHVRGGRFIESDIYDDSHNADAVRIFDRLLF
jgi:predicted N-acetyltransferase YhbS